MNYPEVENVFLFFTLSVTARNDL